MCHPNGNPSMSLEAEAVPKTPVLKYNYSFFLEKKTFFRPLDAPSVPDLEDDFRLDSEQVNEDWLNEKGRVLTRRHFLRIVRKDWKMAINNNAMEKPLIWSYLTKRNSNSYKNFHI